MRTAAARRCGSHSVSGERRLLVLYWSPDGESLRSATRAHLRALETIGASDRVITYNAGRGAPSWLRHFRPDAVLLHTTFLGLRWVSGFERRRERSAWVADLRCPKLAFPQDDYDHAAVLDAWLDELGVDVVMSPLAAYASLLYPRTSRRADFRHVLTGYVDDAALVARGRPARLVERSLDVVYRATRLPFWFGSHGQLKHHVGVAAAESARRLGLAADVSTTDRDAIVGDRWLDFLASGRAVPGCESGSSALDASGGLRATIQSILAAEPRATFEDVATRLPADWDAYPFRALSPRHLEAAATGTAQILVEGTYEGVLEPHRHYVPVRRDLADLDDALALTRTPDALQPLADTAFAELCLSGRYSYRRFSAAIDAALRDHGAVERHGRTRGFTAAGRAAAAVGELERRAAAAARSALRLTSAARR